MSWSREIQEFAKIVLELEASILPNPPWALHVSETVPVGRSTFFGGPYYKVTDNGIWLESIKREIKQGPEGARSKTGALQADLKALAGVLF